MPLANKMNSWDIVLNSHSGGMAGEGAALSSGLISLKWEPLTATVAHSYPWSHKEQLCLRLCTQGTLLWIGSWMGNEQSTVPGHWNMDFSFSSPSFVTPSPLSPLCSLSAPALSPSLSLHPSLNRYHREELHQYKWAVVATWRGGIPGLLLTFTLRHSTPFYSTHNVLLS